MTKAANFSLSRRALGGLGLGLAATGTARAQDMAGKTIEWIIPFAVGGGSDVWARFHLPLLQKHMPGNPTIVIRNVTGGGSIVRSFDGGSVRCCRRRNVRRVGGDGSSARCSDGRSAR